MADLVKISKIKTSAGEHEIDAKYWGGKTIDVLNDLNNMEEITYSDLNILKTGSKLIKGKQYRITDYVTTTTQENTQSAGHSFDIIVTADSNNTFNEVARACLHSGDTYFSGVNMDAWEIKYSFDNDTNRFAWASSSGKGVIYYMKDEWNNECPYDFKNIKFKRDSSWISSHKSNFSGLTSTTQSELWFYTFSRISGTSTVTVSDDSFNNELSDSVYPCRNNSIGVYSIKDSSVIKCYLNDTIFIGNGAESNHFGENSKNNTFTGIYNNYFDMGCQDNIAYKGFSTNNIGINFKSNIITDKFQYNNIDTNFNGNQLGQFLSCSVGDGFKENNSIGQIIKYCDFGHFIQRCSDLPSMMNVVFDNEIVKNTEYNKGLKNVTLSTGETAYNALEKLSDNTSKILFTKQDDVYYIVSVANHEEKLEAIYDLGSFSTNGDGENAANKINIIRNPKILFIKFYNEQKGKDVYIQQMVVDHNCSVGSYGYAKQYIYLDGKVSYRKCWFINALGVYQTVSDTNHNSNWITVEDADGLLYSGGVKTLTVNDATNFVTLNGDQTITGSKRFDSDINLAGKTIIKNGSNIDAGELKVFKANDSTAGFTIRTNGKFSNNVPKLELLATNNNEAYKYQFPQLANTIDPDYVVVKSQLDEVIEDERNYVYIEWGELVSLKNNGELKPGRKYRITDYVTTTSQENTQSAGHQFDIIVEALNENTLSENAKAIQNENDVYFDGSNLEAWELKYCLDNDTSRFAWALDSNKITTETYRIKPELIVGEKFIEPFIFVGQILVDTSEFIYEGSEEDIIYEWGYETEPNGENSLYIIKNGVGYEGEGMDYNDKHYYRGTITIDDVVYDKWEKYDGGDGFYYVHEQGEVYFLTKQIVEEGNSVVYCGGKGVIYYMKDEFNNECPYDFKNIQFVRYKLNPPTVGGYDNEWQNQLSENVNKMFVNDQLSYIWHGSNNEYNYFWDNSGEVTSTVTEETKAFYTFSNVIGDEITDKSLINVCYSNVIKDSFKNKVLKLNNNIFFSINIYNYCYSNIFGNNCDSNSFGESCHSNSFGESCSCNIFGDFCHSNSFGIFCHSNSFGDDCDNNSFGNYCKFNSFNDFCDYNILGTYCDLIIFGNECRSNIFGDSCHSNSFGNECHSNSFGNYCTTNSFGNDCKYNSFGNECISNSFGEGCKYNTFGNYCNSNIFGETCISNIFGNDCKYNSFDKSCVNNSFENACAYNIFGNYCSNNSFGIYCMSNIFGNYCHSNAFSNECTYNGFYVAASYSNQANGGYIVNSEKLNYVKNITISEGCEYLLVYTNQTTNSSNFIQNITITKGVKSISNNAPLPILISDVNNEYEIKVAKNTSGELKIYCEADLIA